MKIILIGSCGKMGQEVKKNLEPGDKIVAEVDQNKPLTKRNLHADVIIDFSSASDRSKYFDYAKKWGVPYACFATGLTENDEKGLDALASEVKVLKCKNASKGVNLLYDLTALACKELQGADVVLTEIHHKAKKDSPSGTAKELEKILTEYGVNYETVCHRVGNEKGYHELKFFLGDEVVVLSHHAFSRSIFAKGALEKARKLVESEF